MRPVKQAGTGKTAGSIAGRLLAHGPHRTVDRITPRQMRDFDARVDRAMEQAKQVSADLKKIGRK